MKKYYIDEIPTPLRQSFLKGQAFTIFDTERLTNIALLDVLPSKVKLLYTRGAAKEFSDVKSALESIGVLEDADIPDLLFLLL